MLESPTVAISSQNMEKNAIVGVTRLYVLLLTRVVLLVHAS